ncbi:MAG: glycosyltransferase [Thermodesulfobacteriota bacterium]
MKADLHVHSKYSKRPSEWILQKLGCAESYTDPHFLYSRAKAKGMSLVTITDHNVIDGCLELTHKPDCFISEEITTYFPEDRCKIHVLAYNIDEKTHNEIQRLRENIYDLVEYLYGINVLTVVAHPLFSVNSKLTVEHFEKLLLMFKNFELNGARSEDQNRCLKLVLSSLTAETIDRLADKHGMEPKIPVPWMKNLVGGSDDHSSLTIACRHTQVPGATNLDDFLMGIISGKAIVHGVESTPKTLGRNLYSIAYQFYSLKFNAGQYANDDVLFNLLDRFLHADGPREPGWTARLHFLWSNYRRKKAHDTSNDGILSLLIQEAHKLMWDDPQLSPMVRNGNHQRENVDRQLFGFVNTISNRVLCHFTEHIIDSFSGAHFVNLFGSLGSAGALYCLLAPYFVSFSIFSEDRKLGKEVLRHFTGTKHPQARSEIRVAHFTDTLYETNGVARTLRKQARAAARVGKAYEIITCGDESHRCEEGIRTFLPVGVYELSVYPEQKLYYPPFLDMLDYCYRQDFTHIHAATPGPLGLAALSIARILRLPMVGTYHTALPQYAEYLTGDHSIAEIMWKYVIWFYDQMNCVHVPSAATANELIDRGLPREKIVITPRGVEIDEFSPENRNGMFDADPVSRGMIRVLYVGRVSREKNLHLLVTVFKEIAMKRQDVCLIVVGDGPYREEMQQALHGVPALFTGYLHGKALAAAYASSDLFVLPSTTDTFGNVVLEAQASGLPVIVTDVGGPQENVIHGKTGMVVKGNDEEGLKEAILTLVADGPGRKAMGLAARAYAEGRSFEKAFLKTWDMYSSVLLAARPSVAHPLPGELAASILGKKHPFAA